MVHENQDHWRWLNDGCRACQDGRAQEWLIRSSGAEASCSEASAPSCSMFRFADLSTTNESYQTCRSVYIAGMDSSRTDNSRSHTDCRLAGKSHMDKSKHMGSDIHKNMRARTANSRHNTAATPGKGNHNNNTLARWPEPHSQLLLKLQGRTSAT